MVLQAVQRLAPIYFYAVMNSDLTSTLILDDTAFFCHFIIIYNDIYGNADFWK
jgi:hypothetical protein